MSANALARTARPTTSPWTRPLLAWSTMLAALAAIYLIEDMNLRADALRGLSSRFPTVLPEALEATLATEDVADRAAAALGSTVNGGLRARSFGTRPRAAAASRVHAAVEPHARAGRQPSSCLALAASM